VSNENSAYFEEKFEIELKTNLNDNNNNYITTHKMNLP
jgi:hypothetical protein